MPPTAPRKPVKAAVPIDAKERQKHLREVFDLYDRDNSGDIDADELYLMFQELGLHKRSEDIQHILEKTSAAGQMSLTFDQFVELFSASRLLKVFNTMDADGSGTIDKDEIQMALKKLGIKLSRHQCEEMLEAVDQNGDGEISFEEFKAFFEGLPVDSMETIAMKWAEAVMITDVGSGIDFTTQMIGLTLQQSIFTDICAGIGSRTLTAPLENIKVRAQAGKVSAHSSMLRDLQSIYRRRGLRGLWASNLTNCLRVVPTAVISCGVYVQLMSMCPTDSELPHIDTAEHLACGGAAALVSTVLTYPLDTIRTRLSMSDLIGGGGGIRGAAKEITRSGGFGAMFRGIGPAAAAVVPFVVTQNFAIDCLRDAAIEDGFTVSPAVLLGIGAASGLLAQTLVHPLEVLRRHMQMRDNFTSPLAELRHIIRREGWSALYAGLVPTYVKIIPCIAVATLITESMSDYFRDRNHKEFNDCCL